MTVEEYLEGWRREFEPRGVWISDEYRRHGAEEWAALDRALGPSPSMDDLHVLRMWRRTQEVFGPVVCGVCPRPGVRSGA